MRFKRDTIKPQLLFTLMAFHGCFSVVAQSTGSISGKVSEHTSPIQGITIRIYDTDFGIVSGADGTFLLTNIPAGSHKLEIRGVGYRSSTQTVSVVAGKNTSVEVSLQKDNLNLNEVVVSGTRYDMDRRESPVIVNVLTPKLFNATQSISLADGLNYQPGVRVETNCQNCGFTQVRLNGLEGAYSQILINSRPIFSALNGVYGLDQIPTNIIDRVETVRSGGSALYGSNAIAGTINILTKDPVENTWQIGSNFASIDGESADNTLNFSGSVVSEDFTSGVTFYGMFRDRESYDANDDGFTELTEIDNNTFGTKAFLKPTKQTKFTLDFNAIREYRRGGDRLNLAPHFTDITEELDHNTIFTGFTFDYFSKDYQRKLSAYVSAQSTQRDSFYGGLGGGRTAEDSTLAINAYGDTEDRSIVGGLQYTHTFDTKNVLVAGVENQASQTKDQTPGYNRLVDQKVNTIGFYSQFEWRVTAALKTLIGARYDYTSVDGFYSVGDVARTADIGTGALSPRVTILYDISDAIQFRGGYARGFRAPQAFNEDLHISSVGGEQRFVILSENLEKELSDAYTASINFTRNFGTTQTNFLVEGFYTVLSNPFTIVSTGGVLPNGSILEETRNGQGAYVSGLNFEANIAPSARFTFQSGGTLQQALYDEDQVLFESETPSEEEPNVITSKFVRTPNFYGYFTVGWKATKRFDVDFTGTHTGSMIVPHVVSDSGFLDLVESDPFLDVNTKLTYHMNVMESFSLELSAGVQNIFNSYQDDFDSGATRDSDYVYGPFKPRTFFFGLKIGNFR